MSLRALAALLLVAIVGALVMLFAGVETSTWSAATAALTLLAAAALVPVARGRARLPRDPVLLAFALLVAGALLSLTVTANVHATLEWTLRLLAAAAAYGLAAHVVPGPTAARRVLVALVAVALVAALYGLWVVLGGHEAVLWLAKAHYRDSLTGTFINRNHFAVYIALHLFPALGFFVAAPGRRRLALLLPLAALLLALALTLSRGGILATAVALPLFVALLPAAGRRRLLPAALALALAGAGLGASNWERLQVRISQSFDPQGEPSAAARLSLWRSTLRAARDRPLLGYGAGTFASFYPRYREVGIARKVVYAHHDYLELAAEQGALGLVLGVAAALLMVVALRRALAGSGPDRPLVAGLAAGVAALAVHAAVDFPLKIPALAVTGAALLGLAVNLGRRQPMAPANAALAPGAARLASLLALPILVLGAARAVQVGLADRHLRHAETVFMRPAWDEAAASYQRAIAIDPLDPRGWGGLAHSELNRAKFRIRDGKEARHRFAEAALAHLGEAEARDPLHPDVKLERAWLFNFLGRHAEAGREYQRAVAADPANANVLFHAAAFHLHRRDTGRGLELMSRAVRAWPNFFGGKIAEIHQAVRDPERVLAILPDDQPFLAFQYAVFLADRGEEAAARRAFDRATRGGGFRPEWVIPFAGLIARKDSRAAAVELYASIPAESRSAAMEIEVARMLDGDGRREEAIDHLARAASRLPPSGDLVRTLALFGGDRPAVHQALDRYRAEAGEDAGYALARGWLELGGGDFGAAAASFEQVLAERPVDPWARSGRDRAFAALARQAEEQGDCALAEELELRAAW